MTLLADEIRTCGTALGGIMGLTCGSTMLPPDEEAERGVPLVWRRFAIPGDMSCAWRAIACCCIMRCCCREIPGLYVTTFWIRPSGVGSRTLGSFIKC